MNALEKIEKGFRSVRVFQGRPHLRMWHLHDDPKDQRSNLDPAFAKALGQNLPDIGEENHRRVRGQFLQGFLDHSRRSFILK